VTAVSGQGLLKLFRGHWAFGPGNDRMFMISRSLSW